MSYNKPIASTTEFGVVKVGSGINVSAGVISANGASYSPDIGQFYSSVTQTNVNSVNTATFNNTEFSQGITLASNSRITVSKTDNYSFSFTLQFTKSSSSGSSARGFFWLRKNGVNVANSASDTITNETGSGVLTTWNYLISLNTGDYIEIVWNSTASNAILLARPAQAGPPSIPLSPSIRATIVQL